MTKVDSKKLEGIEKWLEQFRNPTMLVDYWSVFLDVVPRLLSKVKEQDRKIQRLRDGWGRWNKQNKETDYQRRHRKWALEEARALRKIANNYLKRNDTLRAEKAEAQLKDAEHRWQCERERVMKAKAEVRRWQKKKWEIEEKYNQLFKKYTERGRSLIRLDNRNKKVEAVLELLKSGLRCEARDRELMLEAQLKDCATKIRELEKAAQ